MLSMIHCIAQGILVKINNSMISEQKCQIASDGSLSFSDEFVWEKHTSGVGTSTYAAPEQLEGTLYNYKVVN